MKQIYLMLAMLATCLCANAQEITNKDFNKLKRSNNYYFYEVTLPDESQAKEFAIQKLASLVADSIKAKSPDIKVSGNNLPKDKVLFLIMNRETGVRVMAYCDKVSLVVIDDTNGEVKEAGKPTTTVQQSKPTATPESDVKQQPTSNEVSAKQVSSSPSVASNVNIPDWINRSLEQLKTKETIASFCAELETLKGKFRVKRYGVRDNCRDASKCYWAVFDNSGQLTAILGDGAASRHDFISGTEHSLDKYASYPSAQVIWFQFSK